MGYAVQGRSRSRRFRFGSFSFMGGGGHVDISAPFGTRILLARPCEKIEREAEAVRDQGRCEARHRDVPRIALEAFLFYVQWCLCSPTRG